MLFAVAIVGTEASKISALECIIKNFDNFKSDNGVKMKPRKLQTLRELEWPIFDIGWPTKVSSYPRLLSGPGN